MLKVVVFDSGYGGELFADRLKDEFPLIEIIRVIDWRNSDTYLKNPRKARLAAEKALRPYIGRANLIVVANYLLASTSLKYFEHKYKSQNFLGLELPYPGISKRKRTTILTTKAMARTISYHNYLFRLKGKTDTICLDHWVELIDDGELTEQMVYREIEKFYIKYHYKPVEIIVACSQFCDAVPLLKNTLTKNLKIHDGFDDTIAKVFKILKIRGGTGKKKKH